MPRERREIQKEDIMPLDVYTKNRKELRKNIVNFKKDRRIALGPYATFYFESYETMLAQVQEMLYIEKGGEEQLKDDGEIIKAIPEEDVDRTSSEGKASSVQFIHFKFTDEQIQKFKSNSSEVEIGIDHNEYTHTTKLSSATLNSLSADFN
jgi:hypothetical protein